MRSDLLRRRNCGGYLEIMWSIMSSSISSTQKYAVMWSSITSSENYVVNYVVKYLVISKLCGQLCRQVSRHLKNISLCDQVSRHLEIMWSSCGTNSWYTHILLSLHMLYGNNGPMGQISRATGANKKKLRDMPVS